MSCEYDGCPIEKFCEDVSIGIEDCCGTLRAYRKGKADERKKVLDEVISLIYESYADAGTLEYFEAWKNRLEQMKGGKT